MRLAAGCDLREFAAPWRRNPARKNCETLSMRPTTPTTAAERRVLRWFLAALAIGAVLLLGFTWHDRRLACETGCRTRGATAGELRFNGGGRWNLGSSCECVGLPAPRPQVASP
jgi:hypothetical protein